VLLLPVLLLLLLRLLLLYGFSLLLRLLVLLLRYDHWQAFGLAELSCQVRLACTTASMLFESVHSCMLVQAWAMLSAVARNITGSWRNVSHVQHCAIPYPLQHSSTTNST
jgi:hypothetical protein